jgi:hypothetical protein
MSGRFTKKRAFVAIGLVAALAVAGAAYAFFQSTGSGTGTASVGSATQWSVLSGTSNGPMYPGSTSSDESVKVTITNKGSGNQSLNSFTMSVAQSNGSAWTSSTTNYPSENACSATDFALGTNTAAGSYTVDKSVDATLPDDLAPGASYSTTVNLHMLDTGVPQDNCQGLTNVPLYITAK